MKPYIVVNRVTLQGKYVSAPSPEQAKILAVPHFIQIWEEQFLGPRPTESILGLVERNGHVLTWVGPERVVA